MLIKCEYCNRYNDSSLRDCPSCAAPIDVSKEIAWQQEATFQAERKLQDLKIQRYTDEIYRKLRVLNPMTSVNVPPLTCIIKQ